MGEDQMQVQDKDHTSTPLPPCASPQSPSRKRLLADSKPKQGSAATSSDSIMSSDLSSDRLRKKTRDLPNFSDCRCCGLRVNGTNPKDKLQTLDSLWRIVLLCKKCLKRVDSAELCSYCFKEDENDCYRCRDCDRRVHRGCVERYRCSAPWSYCSELGFSVCIDCWVPKLMINSYKARKRGNKKNASKQCVEAGATVSGSCAKPKLLEDVVNDAKSLVEKKSAMAAKAKGNALTKAVVARRAVELANGALELIAKKDENGAKNDLLSVSSSTAMVDDVELAFQLHRVMNSSPRISKNSSLMNSSSVTARRLWDYNGNLSLKLVTSRESPDDSVSGKIEACTNNALNESIYGIVSEPSVNARDLHSVSRIGLGNIKFHGLVYSRRCKKGLVYSRRCKKGKDSWERDGGIKGNCYPGVYNSLISEYQSCHKQDELGHELFQDDTIKESKLVRDKNADRLDNEKCNRELDRYMVKYRRRPVGFKAIFNSGTKILYAESDSAAMGSPPPCSEESRAYCNMNNRRKEDGLMNSWQGCKIWMKDLSLEDDTSKSIQIGGFEDTCPDAEPIVSSIVRDAALSDPNIAPVLLRLHFHDCFVQGCDGSILIDNGPSAERHAFGHQGVGGFEVIERAKQKLEAICPRVVSCADIVALAARDAVALASGPVYQVPTGRRDGVVSNVSMADEMPDVSDSIQQLKFKFFRKGLSERDLVLLSAAHTIGTTACFFMTKRLYNFFPGGGSDPSINPDFLPELKALCPQNGDVNTRLPIDHGGAERFDANILWNIRRGFAVLESDARLYDDLATRIVVDSYTGSFNQIFGPNFEEDFARSMVKMGQIGVRTGSEGQIRLVCGAFN